MGISYRTIGVVNVNNGRTVVKTVDRAAIQCIKELEEQVRALEKDKESLSRRAKAAESALAHARMLGAVA